MIRQTAERREFRVSQCMAATVSSSSPVAAEAQCLEVVHVQAAQCRLGERICPSYPLQIPFDLLLRVD